MRHPEPGKIEPARFPWVIAEVTEGGRAMKGQTPTGHKGKDDEPPACHNCHTHMLAGGQSRVAMCSHSDASHEYVRILPKPKSEKVMG